MILDSKNEEHIATLYKWRETQIKQIIRNLSVSHYNLSFNGKQ